MSLSNVSHWPDWYLIQRANELPPRFYLVETVMVEELDLRKPNEATSYFGDCAGKAIFIPIEPEHDSNGQPIIEEVIGYDEEGEIWITKNI